MTLDNAYTIAGNGLDVQAERIKIHADNIANAGTPNYVRKVPILSESTTTSFQDVISSMRNGNMLKGGISETLGGVEMSGVMEDPTPGKKIYQPGNPEADKDGYVTYSNVDILSDMADATATARLYEANLAVLKVVGSMENQALNIGKSS